MNANQILRSLVAAVLLVSAVAHANETPIQIAMEDAQFKVGDSRCVLQNDEIRCTPVNKQRKGDTAMTRKIIVTAAIVAVTALAAFVSIDVHGSREAVHDNAITAVPMAPVVVSPSHPIRIAFQPAMQPAARTLIAMR